MTKAEMLMLESQETDNDAIDSNAQAVTATASKYYKQAESDLAPLLGVRSGDTSPGAAFTRKTQKFIGRSGSTLTTRLPGLHSETESEYLDFKRSQVFETDEYKLAESYVESLHEVATLEQSHGGDSPFWPTLSSTLVEQSIAKYLTAGQPSQVFGTVMDVLNHLKVSSTSTYEGVAISQNFVVGPDDRNAPGLKGISLKEYVDRDINAWTPNLGGSRGTAVFVTHDGQVTAVGALPSPVSVAMPSVSVPTEADGSEAEEATDQSPFLWPEGLERMALATQVPGVIGFSVMGGGDISVLRDGEVKFIHRRGSWRAIPSNLKAQKWGGVKPAPAVRRAILESLIDASYEKHGATIAVLRSSKRDQFLADCRADADQASLVNPNHLWIQIGGAGLGKGKNRNPEKPHGIDIRRELVWQGLRKPNDERCEIGFAELSRSQRLELLSMDGATILDNQGTILASGVIVKVSGGGSGGRTGAALALANFGCAFKVSQDGEVLLYNEGRRTHEEEGDGENRIVNRFG